MLAKRYLWQLYIHIMNRLQYECFTWLWGRACNSTCNDYITCMQDLYVYAHAIVCDRNTTGDRRREKHWFAQVSANWIAHRSPPRWSKYHGKKKRPPTVIVYGMQIVSLARQREGIHGDDVHVSSDCKTYITWNAERTTLNKSIAFNAPGWWSCNGNDGDGWIK